MRLKTAMLIAAGLVLLGCPSQKNYLNHRFFDLAREQETRVDQVLPELTQSRLILVGEQHDNPRHHRAQLEVIRLLHENGQQVAVGLEMFRRDSQTALDRWIAGETDVPEFQKIYYDNWNFPWPLYADIFKYARENRIPIVGLNVPRDITSQVARGGYASLSESQKQSLGDVTCRVDKEYMEYIRRAYGAHAHGKMQFLYFCEAQMVWDAAMAVNALEYLQRHPQRVMVLLAGTGHARKQAIPTQVRQRSDIPVTVILPEVPGIIDPDTLHSSDADLIYLGL